MAPRVLMIGTALSGRGGIAAVVSVLARAGLFDDEGVRYLATHAEGWRAYKAGLALAGFWRTALVCLFQRPAVVHAHAASHASFFRKSLLLLLARCCGARTVFQLHGGGFREFANGSDRLARWWIRHTLEASSVVIALSEGWADFLAGFAPRARLRIVPNAVDVASLSSACAEETGRIVFLGRADTCKGIDDLLAAMSALAPSVPAIRLAVAGVGDLALLRKRASQLGIEARVELLGWIGAREKADQLARASVFCLPSHAEGMPMAMLEAMAVGKAVVVSRVGGMPEAVSDGDNGLLVPPSDAQALAGALSRLLSDEVLRRRLGARARQTVAQRFSTTVVAGQLASVYRELCQAGTLTPRSRRERLAWLANRLRCMSVGELGYRMRQSAAGRLDRLAMRGWTAPAPRNVVQALPLAATPPLEPGEADSLLADAARIRDGNVPLFANCRYHVGRLPDWNRDPATGVLGPSVFAGGIRITDRDLVGDIKHVWELNRHLHLVRLAQAWRISGDDAWLAVLQQQVCGWLKQCPPMTGPNWISPLEMGIRLINWALVWQLAGGASGPLFAGEPGRALQRAWLDSIYTHCRCIARRLSRHSSANNHLIGELAGLYVAATVWPCWDRSARWREQAARELEHEAQAQFSSDGVNREQAFAYHVFSSEFLSIAALAGQAAGRPFSARYLDTLERALVFLRSVTDVGGRSPMVGDADDGIVYRLDPDAHDRAALLLSQGKDATARWLLHAFPGTCVRHGPPVPATGWAFPDGGYLLFGRDFGTPREIKGMLDCGPLGYLGIAAHGHADALALTLSVAGEECLADPGTYSYWQERKWRDYFRGTSAHNTVRVDGADQSVSGGRFMWLHKARTRVERMPHSPGQFDFCGSHDGYWRLPDPVRHRRAVRFDEAASTLVVRDWLQAKGIHRLEQFWHFAPGLDVTRSEGGIRVAGKRFGVELEVCGEGAETDLTRGQEDPPLGWYSRRYEEKEPCTVVKITTNSNGAPLECRFTISFS